MPLTLHARQSPRSLQIPFLRLGEHPQARVIAAAETVAAIRANVEKKLAVWGPQLKDNGPQTLDDVVIPETFAGKTLTVDGQTIEIVDAEGLANRRYLRVPAVRRCSAALIAAMKRRFPRLGMEVALDIGAKVATGEMKWG